MSTPLRGIDIIKCCGVACSVYDRIGSGDCYYGAESAGSLIPLTMLNPDAATLDLSPGNGADAACLASLSVVVHEELQKLRDLMARMLLRRYAPSVRTKKEAAALKIQCSRPLHEFKI